MASISANNSVSMTLDAKPGRHAASIPWELATQMHVTRVIKPKNVKAEPINHSVPVVIALHVLKIVTAPKAPTHLVSAPTVSMVVMCQLVLAMLLHATLVEHLVQTTPSGATKVSALLKVATSAQTVQSKTRSTRTGALKVSAQLVR
jgi:hypothetical protein